MSKQIKHEYYDAVMRPFKARHIGPDAAEIDLMCQELGVTDVEQIIKRTVPANIYNPRFTLPSSDTLSETQALAKLQSYFAADQPYRQFYGMGYYPAITPPALQRYLFENPGWYTPYTPYQAEISQGRLELLFLFQTLCCELTGLPLAGASLLDEGTAAAEAMSLSFAHRPIKSARNYLVAKNLFPQTLAVVISRAKSLGIAIKLWDMAQYQSGKLKEIFASDDYFGALLGYPDSSGQVHPLTEMVAEIKHHGGIVACCTDLLALTLLPPPAELGVDIACGSAQRLGVPLGYGGPHAAFFACASDYQRKLPGRVVGRSVDAAGAPAYRLALQTREQHIRRERATSNICTAQALLASMAAAYAVYHGKYGLRTIAEQIYEMTQLAARWLMDHDVKLETTRFFDTVRFQLARREDYELAQQRATDLQVNLLLNYQRTTAPHYGQFSLAEAHSLADLGDLLWVITGERPLESQLESSLEFRVTRTTRTTRETYNLNRVEFRDPQTYLTQEIFSKPPSELEFMRWLKRLENKDISLTHSMIPLGSCTMKLNAAAELTPLSWSIVQESHPYQPTEQVKGYQRMMADLQANLAAITGLDSVSFQPNSGAQGEYAGLMTIMSYMRSIDQSHRRICLVPASAHGTNPASAVMAGMKVVVIRCDDDGNIDLSDLNSKLAAHGTQLACLMVTYPSTHGVFEPHIRLICELVHEAGGQVYLDGANLNAQLGICVPGEYGVDVCHMNLHKTFCIPHGGGGPGAGPIAVAAHLRHHLPQAPITLGMNYSANGELTQGYSVASCHYGSPSILIISWMYLQMMGASGLQQASQVAVLSANYMAAKLAAHYPVLYKGKGGWVAHECLLDLRGLQKTTTITVEDVAKRLMDFGFHAPTISFPIPGTLMIEPTESEGLDEMSRFLEAMVVIRQEIAEIESGQVQPNESPLKGAPHPWWLLTQEWTAAYSPQQACFPLPWLKERKVWPSTQRIDNAYGDRQLVCACDPIEAYQS